jgi:hypothetical protein
MTQRENNEPQNEERGSEQRQSSAHDNHCFIVMPHGRSPKEIRWFKGWYDVVIKPAIIASNYEPILSAAEERPSAINDEIRAHLAFDPMTIVDLGGFTAEEDPNPNVMYELGIRHALGLPLVMMAWKDQRLPFDVGNQRVIMEGRELLDLEVNRVKLGNFIRAAAAGHYYRPMDAVGRIATLEQASIALGEDSVLGALVREVNEMRTAMLALAKQRPPRARRAAVPTLKRLLHGKQLRSELYGAFMAAGGTNKQWAQLLKMQFTEEGVILVAGWGLDDWREFVVGQATQWVEMGPAKGEPAGEQPNGGTLVQASSAEPNSEADTATHSDGPEGKRSEGPSPVIHTHSEGGPNSSLSMPEGDTPPR